MMATPFVACTSKIKIKLSDSKTSGYLKTLKPSPPKIPQTTKKSLLSKDSPLADREKDSEEEEAIPNQMATSSQLGRKVNNVGNAKKPSQKQKVASSQLGRKVDHAENAKEPTPISKKARAVLSLSGQEVLKKENTKQAAAPKSKKSRAVSSLSGQEVHKEENTKQTAALKASSTQLGRNAENTENAKEQTSRSGRRVKPTAKAKEPMSSSARRPESLPTSEPSREVNDYIVQLTDLLDNRNKYERPMPTTKAPSAKSDEHPIKILESKIHSPNSSDQDHFVFATQFEVEELDQLKKNQTFILTQKSGFQPGHRPLAGK